jgi:hypothetical protein
LKISNFQDGDTFAVMQEGRDGFCNAIFNAGQMKPVEVYRRMLAH